jgi:gliding motility-associated-like protein
VDTTICESKNVTLTTNSNATSFSWTPAIGLNSTTVQNPIATPLVTTKYYVTATLGNCSKQDSVTVIVNPAPVPDAGPGITICFGKSYTLQGSGGVSYTWANANTLANTSSSTPIATPSTTTTYTLSNVIDANGCISLTTDTVTVIVTPPIIANAGRDTVIVMGQPYQLNATGATLFSWSPAFGLSNPTIANPIATIFASQIYTVEVSTPEGCKGFANVKLEVLKGPDIYVPTAFTPNGDGINDVFKVFPVGIKQFNYLRIFNRWGQKIFETQNDKIGWDAIFHSIKQPTGAYIYTVEGVTDAGKVITKKGTLIIAR